MNITSIKKCKLEKDGVSTEASIHHYLSVKDSSAIYSTEDWSITILRSGMIEYEFDNVKMRITENEMMIIPVNKEIRITVKEGSSVTVIFFYNQLSYCNKYFVDDLIPDSEKLLSITKIKSLKLHTYIQQMLDIEQAIFTDGNNCFYSEKIFINQLLLLIRNYYSREDLISFFSIMKSKNIDFKSYILLNYENKDIHTLADECNMSVPTFNRYFRNNFGESALQWLNRKKADVIYRELISSVKTFAEIAYDNKFSSTSYLTAFCKRYFNMTPDQIRKQPQE